MRIFALLALVATAACATTGQPSAPGLPGTYALESVNGHLLPSISPQEPNLTVTRGSITLVGSGAFSMSVLATNSPQLPAVERTMHGTWTVSGDTLALTPGPGQEDAGRTQHMRFSRAGTELVLRDEQGNRFRFLSR